MDGWLAFVLVFQLILFLQIVSLSGKVGDLEARLNRLLKNLGEDMAALPPLSDNVKALAADPSRKIDAIRQYRNETGVGLKDAKDAVEAYIRGMRG